MKAIHIRDVDSLVLKRIGQLARHHRRSMQAELRVILEEAARRAEVLETDTGDDLIIVQGPSAGNYGRQELYTDDAR